MARHNVAYARQAINRPLRRRGPYGSFVTAVVFRRRMARSCFARGLASACVPLVAAAIALMLPVPATAAPTVRTMFTDASQKERAVRTALADPAVSSAVLKSVRHVIASYELVVRRYPTSSYSDDALWQAGRLALDVFAKFGDVQDRESGLRMLRWLAAEYPSSKLAKQVPDVLSAVNGAAPAAAAPTVQPTGTRGSNQDAARKRQS